MFFFFSFLFSEKKIVKNIEKVKSAVLCIEGRTALASSGLGRHAGTGFIVDKKKGYVITNAHVSGGRSLTSLELITSKGKRRMEAKHVFSHPFIDFSIIKFDPLELKDVAEELPINANLPEMNEEVLIISNSEANNFSIHEGQVSNFYETMGFFSIEAIRISVVARGGTSGAAVVNSKGEAVALTFAGSQGNAIWAIPMSYIKDILDKIEKNEPITIADPGFFLDYISIDDAHKNYGVPQDGFPDYIKKFPKSFNRALIVGQVRDFSYAKGKVLAGDIICAINGKEVGPSHYAFDKACNEALAAQKDIDMTVWRNGKKVDVKISMRPAFYREKYLKFGGSTFCQASEVESKLFSIKPGTPIITQIEAGSMFYDLFQPTISSASENFYAIVITHINNKPVKDFETTATVMKDLIAKKTKDFFVTYRNVGISVGFNGFPVLNRFATTQYLSIKTPRDNDLVEYKLKETPNGDEWESKVTEES